LAVRRERTVRGRIDDDAEPETETDARHRRLGRITFGEGVRLQVDAAGKVVQRHVLERLASDDGCTAAHESACEAVVVVDGADQPAGSRFELRWLLVARLERYELAVLALVALRETVDLVFGDPERGIRHAERLEDV